MSPKAVLMGASLLLVAAGPLAAADAGKVYKSEKGTCEVTLPADWAIDDFAATDPGKTLTVMVFHEWDAKVEKLDDSVMKMAHHPSRVFENSGQRLFVESEVPAFGPEPPSRKWESLVPARPQGACQVILILKSGASEDVARKIALSLVPVP